MTPNEAKVALERIKKIEKEMKENDWGHQPC